MKPSKIKGKTVKMNEIHKSETIKRVSSREIDLERLLLLPFRICIRESRRTRTTIDAPHIIIDNHDF
jgi:hypothetical protein